MVSEIITMGNKIDIRVVQQALREQETGEKAHVYFSQIENILSPDRIVVTIPIEMGKIILLPQNIRYEFCFFTKRGLYRCNAQLGKRFKNGNIFLQNVTLESPLVKFQRREFFRLEIILDIQFRIVAEEELNFLNEDDLILYRKSLGPGIDIQYKGTMVDFSGGGSRFISNQKCEFGTEIFMNFKVKNPVEKQYCIRAHIIQCTKADTVDRQYEYRVSFTDISRVDREDIVRFIFEEERKKRKNDKG